MNITRYYKSIPLIFLLLFSFNSTQGKTIFKTPGWYIIELYQMIKDTHEIFVANNLEYWIDGGTLLGAIRHKGIIPWDDDADINIDLKDKDLFFSLEPIFNKFGYEFKKMSFGYKILPKKGTYHGPQRPFIDVFFMVEKNNKIYFMVNCPPKPHRGWTWLGRRGKEPVFITKDELYPLQEYTFGEIKLLGAKESVSRLNYRYKDWNKIAVLYNHSFGLKKETIQLPDQERVPAQPTGPLVNRIS